jgi:hypothetical protein
MAGGTAARRADVEETLDAIRSFGDEVITKCA